MKKYYFLLALVLSLFLTSAVSAAYQYTLMEDIPGMGTICGAVGGANNNQPADMATCFPLFVRAIYNFGIWSIGIASLLMISVGAFVYITAAGNTSKAGNGKTIITDAIIGLVMALTAWLLLNTINPDLTGNSLSSLPSITSTTSKTVATADSTDVTGVAGTGGLSGLQTQSGINKQASNMSDNLMKLAACLSSQNNKLVVTSVSDSAGFDRCKYNWSRPPCAHAETSCHYGGGKTQTNNECKQSYAIDISTRNMTPQTVIDTAKKCTSSVPSGIKYKDESASANHIHLSTASANCVCDSSLSSL